MTKITTNLLALAFLLLPVGAEAEPIKLKLSFFTSDRSVAYQSAIKPFVDAVNSEGKGRIQIDVYLNGSLGKVQSELPRLLLDGATDMAFIVPGQNPERFLDNAIMGLPGLFRDVREATLVHTRLAFSGALAGYKDFYVVGAFATEPETIHTRKALRSLDDLRGQKIRANNLTEAAALAKLGALPIVLAFNETTPAISSGLLDGATVPPAQLFDVGIGRLVSNHYFLPISAAPLTLMMNRSAFDNLPQDAKAILRKYAGDWIAARYIEAFEAIGRDATAQIRSDSRRSVVDPSPGDLKTARAAFNSVSDEWISGSSHNRDLLTLVEKQLAEIRSNH
jgi:TRAP-type C4-dicarboxylate transport system substrate-binding protein